MIFFSIIIIIVALSLPFISQKITSIWIIRSTALIFLYAGAISFNAFYIQSIGSGIGIYSGLFQVTVLSQFMDIFFLIIGGLILVSWKNSKTYIDSYGKEYSLIILFSVLGSLFLISSIDLISMYLSLELQSFSLYILSTIYKELYKATSAGLKYFLLGGLSSCIILLGSSLTYTYTGTTNLESIYSLVSVINNNNFLLNINNNLDLSALSLTSLNFLELNNRLSIGIIIIFIGFLFKIAAAPLHNWAPDVYDDSPTIITIWLTIMPKISILIFLLEIVTGLNSYLDISELIVNNTNVLTILLLLSSILSLLIGTIVGLAQIKIKRLLAFSTISHIGFLLLALSINSEQSVESFIFYLIQYSITSLNIFLILLMFGKKYNFSNVLNKYWTNDIEFIPELKYIGSHFLVLSICLAISLFSMAGIIMPSSLSFLI